MRQDLNRLRNENIYIKNELNNLKEKTSEIASQDSFNVVRENQAEMQSQLSNVAKDIQVLNGRFEEHKYSVEKSLNDSSGETEILKAQMTTIETQIKDINEKITMLEARVENQREPVQKQQQDAAKTPEEPVIEPRQPDEAQHSLLDKVKKYEDAYNTFKEKKYKEARTKFESFLKTYPQDDLADNAQFWIAETYYWEKDYENAILSYEIVLKKYTDSQKIPNAFLKQGLSFIELGDKKTGKIILEQVRERYPDTREAELAKTHLDNLKIP
jgi:tol-pal system protein YbgF